MTPHLPPHLSFVYGDRVQLQRLANKGRETATVRFSVTTLKKEIL